MNGYAHLPAGASHVFSSACGRVLCIIIPPHQMTRYVSSVAKMQTVASHTGYAFGPVKETYVTACCPVSKACQTYGREMFLDP